MTAGRRKATKESTILGSGAVMAAGTVFSRMSGFVRSALLAAALGPALHADLFNIANTIPNMLYILLAGGVFNAVLVPQLVRAMKQDPDGGEAYVNRVVTLAALFLGAVTVLLVVFAPTVMSLFLDASFDDPALAAQRASLIDFARFCLPQVFFYGMFVLLGQVLNARGSFGPMMWAPIANNVISVGILVAYLMLHGKAEDVCGAYTSSQELLLGVGSTLGIVAQFLILIPYLRSAGFRYRPRFDFRGSGLGHTLHLGIWTVLFVVVNQIAYTVVVRLASSGTAAGAGSCGGVDATAADAGTGYTVYSSAFLLVMVPHAIVTVSLATAILPALSRLAADGDRRRLSATLSSTLRTALVLVIPFTALLPLIAGDLGNIVWGWGAARELVDNYTPSLALFAPGLLFFTVHYFMLRGFYALEQTRTVFWIQCAVGGTNIVLAVILVRATDQAFTSPALVLAYVGAYLVGAMLSFVVLRRRLGGLQTPALVRFVVRTVIAAVVAAGLARLAWELLTQLLGAEQSKLGSMLLLGVVCVVDGVVFLAIARVMRISEVTELLDVVARRVPGLRRRGT
ncbi:murein biosynthesis integral membrane protein MurJ [Nocardioides daejeonensis]|uniref:murein biosynthesis integral membrane protein MurJ n=1 Tax=Nocardioides daejeonensis TaxID=1046556 RepID=UPI001EF4597C|nr:murein biosynthesis integral membrane protein MurJ [Nocardioides daejeonensis]